MTKKDKSDHNLTKMKIALATGGLMATLIGAGMLGQSANTVTVDTESSNQSSVTVNSGISGSAIDDIDLPDLDLNLEAIPTVSAPTINNTATNSAFNAPMARGRSSG